MINTVKPVVMTVDMLAVIAVFHRAGPTVELSGADVARRAGFAESDPAKVYPLLSRLTEYGWLHDRWEDSKHPRHFHRLTPAGTFAAREAVRRARLILGPLLFPR